MPSAKSFHWWVDALHCSLHFSPLLQVLPSPEHTKHNLFCVLLELELLSHVIALHFLTDLNKFLVLLSYIYVPFILMGTIFPWTLPVILIAVKVVVLLGVPQVTLACLLHVSNVCTADTWSPMWDSADVCTIVPINKSKPRMNVSQWNVLCT
jgi:hypothetical protein